MSVATHPLDEEPGLLAFAGDWHGDRGHARSAIGWAIREGVTGIVQLGDFGIWPGKTGREYLDDVADTLGEDGPWLAFLDGNHEDFWQLNTLPLDADGIRPVRARIWHLPRGLRWIWHDKVWLALGGATSLDRPYRRPGLDWWPEESQTMGQLQSAIDGGPAHYMLTHDCPSGIDIPDLPTYFHPTEVAIAETHRMALRAVVDAVRPQHLWHGHFHVRHRQILRGPDYSCVITGLNDNQGPFPQNVQLVDPVSL